MISVISRKVVVASWHGVDRVFGLGIQKSDFQGFGSEPKRCATKSYADSWWYHLEKCLLLHFHARLRFSFFDHFWRPLPFACFNSGSLVFTKFGHQPYGWRKYSMHTELTIFDIFIFLTISRGRKSIKLCIFCILLQVSMDWWFYRVCRGRPD